MNLTFIDLFIILLVSSQKVLNAGVFSTGHLHVERKSTYASSIYLDSSSVHRVLIEDPH